MTWGMVAVGAATVVGGAIASDSSRKAANTQADAAREANNTQREMYDQTRADNMPALEARNASLARMRELLGIGGNAKAQGYGSFAGGPQDVQADPGYQFGLTQGQNALNSQLTARGMRNSGAALKAAARYGNDYATTKFDDAFNRQTQTLNRFASVAGLGQVGAGQVGQAGIATGQGIAANQIGTGNALAAGSIAQGNAWANAGNQLAGWYGNMNRNSQINGFDGNAVTGYTNQQPWAVGPQQG